MVKIVMVSNEKLTKIKEVSSNMNHNNVILNSLENKRKPFGELKEIIAKMKLRKNDKKIEMTLKKGWHKWTKKMLRR